ncbi:Uncharacterized protein OS=Variovorax paradoxus (strain S110) GN=Vapar_2463 PE=4 SV=1 [Gemmataceae bacterium]|nr:Uncharacterized protein OS=Variovorax paradoxus (strain S110) GN=Vapar_2463 PE=4 SV=1 [Gemmataceae bacterium]VTT98917.1 Uncharacterized protein OS=Variovorax paradoxus (strain S110) GN=Vapar_2463 PE=4 SV=1 [Gemmataceae bacterium]
MPTVRQCDVDPATWAKLRAAAGGEPPKKRKRPDVRAAATGRWSIALALACRVVSEANRRDHWTVQRRRAEIQAAALDRAIEGAGLSGHAPPLPVVVTWTHIGPVELDDDNLARAFKAVRDHLAKWLGVDDADPGVTWKYNQLAGEAGVTVTIASRADPGPSATSTGGGSTGPNCSAGGAASSPAGP